MKLLPLFLLTGAMLCAEAVHGQMTLRNYGFEYYDWEGNPESWSFGNSKNQYRFEVDTVTAHGGKCAVRLVLPSDTAAERGHAGGFTRLLGENLFTRRKVQVSAYVKTEDLADGEAIIGVELHSEHGSLARATSKSPKGTTPWTKYTVELPLTINVEVITLGFDVSGKGKVYFDDFEVLLDGQPVTDAIKLPPPAR